MGKSIRSKAKRKHRTEFRNTIGTEAYKSNFEKLQEKLKECIEKQSTSMEGLERLSKQLGSTAADDEAVVEPQNFDDVTKSNTDDSMAVDGDEKGIADALETTTAPVRDLKGENKAPRKKARRGAKYAYMHKGKGTPKVKDEKLKKKPKYFCQF